MPEQWFAIHDTASGELRSVGTVVDDAALPPSVTKLALAAEPNFRTHRWNAALRAVEAIAPLTADDLVLAMPRKPRLAPTAAVGKAALKDLLDEQITLAQAWDWFSTRVAAGTRPQAVKDAVASLALAEFTEAERLAVAWRSAP